MTLALDIVMVSALAVAVGRSVLLLLLATVDQLRRVRRPAPLTPTGDPEGWPTLSVILPAFNEQHCIGRTVEALCASDYPHLTLVVVDDGSSDRTVELVARLAAADNRIELLRHASNRGKAAALNSGLRAADGELCATVDADTLVAPETLTRLVATLQAENAAAVAGKIRVANQRRWLGLFQAIEYVTNLHLDRRAQSALGTITTVPGATSLWQRNTLLALGCFSEDTLTEDADLTIQAQRAGVRVVFAEHATSDTLTPTTLGALHAQRRRWLRGNLQCAWKHRAGLWSAPFTLRMFGLPNFWFAQLLVYGLMPLALLYLGRALTLFSGTQLLLLFGGLFLFDLLLALLAQIVDGDRRGRQLLVTPLQRLIWPFFLWSVFASVVWQLLLGRPTRWRAPTPPAAEEQPLPSSPLRR